jgi:hypothetical protein
MQEAQRLVLARRAMSRPTSSAGLHAKAQAILRLADENVPIPLDHIRLECEWVLGAEQLLSTYQASRAATMALKVIAMLDGDYEEQWPSETPDELAPAGYWPYDGSRPDQTFEDLDSGDTQGMRDAWRACLLGPPPWKPGKQPVPQGVGPPLRGQSR